MNKPNIIIRMGAAHWDARVRDSKGNFINFNFRSMEKKARSTFHRELMNAFRASRSVA
jgi:hypothetical protein